MGSMADALLKAGLIDAEDIEPEQDSVSINRGTRDFHCLDAATKESPIYLRVSATKSDYDYDTGKSSEYVFFKGVVACTGTKDVEIEETKHYYRKEHQANVMVIDQDAVDKNGKSLFGCGIYGSPESLYIEEQLQPTDALASAYGKALDSIEWTVTAYQYGDVPDNVLKRNETIKKLRNSSQLTGIEQCRVAAGTDAGLTEHIQGVQKRIGELEYQNYCELAKMPELGKTKYHIKDSSVTSFDDVQRYMIENHPQDAIFYGASSNKGSWSSIPAPVGFPVDAIKDREAREHYVELQAERLGCKVGKFEYPDSEPVESVPRKHRGEDVFDIPGSSDISAEFDEPKF